MLRKVVEIIKNTSTEIVDGTVFCRNILIDDETALCVDRLDELSIIENSGFNNVSGSIIDLELSLVRLTTIGYYETIENFILKNKYTHPSNLFYISEIGLFSDEGNTSIYSSHKSIIDLIQSIKTISKHVYTDVDISFALVFKDDLALSLPLTYGARQVRLLSHSDRENINSLCSILSGPTSEKSLLYINELLDYLLPVFESIRFKTLLENTSDFLDKCTNAYQYYLRDFSYHKLKIELDSKALEFTQKIQTVINDSQNKLIAIPTAFILVYAAFNFDVPSDKKNLIAIISLFIFSILIQIFLQNQYSSLAFTEANISTYKETFGANNLEKFTTKFGLVSAELKKQKCRLRLNHLNFMGRPNHVVSNMDFLVD